ncbi:hypothetical protein LIER_42372 [Lithospermum erythrorhizon]|uniref:Uncharacterized protein n=1 Tax=Lithospermum erythrorhizon TaxID=34254 RepID=A0AAV3RQH3_LITER
MDKGSHTVYLTLFVVPHYEYRRQAGEWNQTNHQEESTVDFHFILINYLKRMGIDSPFMTGISRTPSLRG